MTIAINSTQFIKSAGNYLFYDYFVRIASSNPEHQFIFIISPSMYDPPNTFQNTACVISSPLATNPLMWRFWLDYTLPRIARKHNADILINTGGICSLRTRIPQWIFIGDLSFLNFPKFFSEKQLYFLKKNTPAFLAKAGKIVAGSDFLTKEIIRHYSINEKKIQTFQLTPGDPYRIISWKEKEVAKENYAEGKEYFLFSGEISERNNLVNLLKAFSFFKKRQKSNMQLIITGKAVPANDPFIENFKTYKYRKDVNILLDLPEKELTKITAAAYAFIYPAIYEGVPIFPLQAMQCGVPVIIGNTVGINETTGNAGALLHVDAANFEDIADKMMLLFKDETKRTELINKGNLVMQKIKNDKRENGLWDLILKTIVIE